MIRDLHRRYTRPTPEKWRKVGDAFLLFGTTMTGTLAGMEVNKWWVIGMTTVTALGKVITNFVTEDVVLPPEPKI